MSKKIVNYVFNEYTNTIVNRVEYINCGGCGIFAENLYNLLTSFDIKAELMVITNNKAEMIKRIKGEHNDNWKATVRHIVVKVGRNYIDCKQVVDDWGGFGYEDSEITKVPIDKVKEWNRDVYMWNDLFDRRKHKPVIEKGFKKINTKIVKEVLGKVKI
jgi:hypothetical protein